MALSWIHCNMCYCIPTASSNSVFFITSCGHLFCKKCVTEETIGTIEQCRLCKKQTTFSEINRTLREDMQLLFRAPKDLSNEYTQKLKSIIDFQALHHSRLQQHYQDKCQNAIKFAKFAQAEISKRIEMERMIVSERNDAKMELEAAKKRLRELEDSLADRDHEIKRLRVNRQSPFSAQRERGTLQSNLMRSFPNLSNHQTPIDTVSFAGCAASTPIDTGIFDMTHAHSGSAVKSGPSKNILNTPAVYESSSCGNVFMSTPALLGLTNRGNQVPESGMKFDALF